jgi:hypothetical protein
MPPLIPTEEGGRHVYYTDPQRRFGQAQWYERIGTISLEELTWFDKSYEHPSGWSTIECHPQTVGLWVPLNFYPCFVFAFEGVVTKTSYQWGERVGTVTRMPFQPYQYDLAHYLHGKGRKYAIHFDEGIEVSAHLHNPEMLPSGYRPPARLMTKIELRPRS